jgi:pyruvate,water dikinase
VHSVIEAAGRETMYVFDCLSDLADAWLSDRMLGNFFRLTCPRLFDLDTVTYFGVLRNRHARVGMDMITETTQYLLDVFRCRDRLYIRPIKVQHRSAAAMNLIHAWEPGDRFRRSPTAARWPRSSPARAGRGWRTNRSAATGSASSIRREPSPPWRAAGAPELAGEAAAFARLAGLLFPDEAGLQELIARYLNLDDLLAVRARMIGIGTIGGKAAGMLMARAIVRRDAPALHARLEAHDSFYMSAPRSSIPSSCINGLWWMRRRQRDPPRASCAGSTSRRAPARASCAAASPNRPCASSRACWIISASGLSSCAPVRAGGSLRQRLRRPVRQRVLRQPRPREERLAALLDAVRQVYASTLSRVRRCATASAAACSTSTSRWRC